MHLFELVRTLVNIESVSGNEAACTEFLRDYLADRGFEVELQPVEGHRANVFAQRGNPEVVLSTHVDTVPPFFPASEDAEYVYGRGSCDAKGNVAAQIAAAGGLVAEGGRNFALRFPGGGGAVSGGGAGKCGRVGRRAQ